MQRNLATKIRAKQESGLTAVRLKRDPPVFYSDDHVPYNIHNICRSVSQKCDICQVQSYDTQYKIMITVKAVCDICLYCIECV